MNGIQHPIVRLAAEIAHEAHKNKLRKFRLVPYIVHPEAVAAAVKTPSVKVVAWLHDVLEDNPLWTPERLIERGIPNNLVDEVVLLTRKKGESYFDYIMRIAEAGGPAFYVKLADLAHNLSDLNPASQQDLRDKYLLAQALLQTYLVGPVVPVTTTARLEIDLRSTMARCQRMP